MQTKSTSETDKDKEEKKIMQTKKLKNWTSEK